MYPRTLCGRCVVFVCSLYGVTIVSLIVVTLTNLLELDNQQVKVFYLLEKLQAKTAIRDEATEIIGIMAKLASARKTRSSDPKVKMYVSELEELLEKKSVFMNLKRK